MPTTWASLAAFPDLENVYWLIIAQMHSHITIVIIVFNIVAIRYDSIRPWTLFFFELIALQMYLYIQTG